MIPRDISRANFEELKTYFNARLVAVHAAWLGCGLSTTRAAAESAAIDILTFRPRSTELYQLGLLELVKKEGTEGVYRARTLPEWEAFIQTQHQPKTAEQLQLV